MKLDELIPAVDRLHALLHDEGGRGTSSWNADVYHAVQHIAVIFKPPTEPEPGINIIFDESVGVEKQMHFLSCLFQEMHKHYKLLKSVPKNGKIVLTYAGN